MFCLSHCPLKIVIAWEEQRVLNAGQSIMPAGGGGPRVVVSTAAFHARVRGSGFGSRSRRFERNKTVKRVKLSIVGSLCDREVACSASDRKGSNFESCV